MCLDNQAERDLWMVKVQQKIAGTSHREDGATAFCCIRNYLISGLSQVDAPVHIIEGEIHTNAGKFYQVAFLVVVLSPEIALTPVYLDSLILAADQHVLLH